MDSTAKETLEILDQGWYQTTGGRISITEPQEAAVQNTCLIRPSDFPNLAFSKRPAKKATRVQYSVTQERTQAAARRIVQEEGSSDLCVLNFASAKKVGGGFLRGARAQEEDLARSSGLYRCLETQPDYYHANQNCGSFLYTDNMIYSPLVPWFRDNDDVLLEQPFLASIITAPAPNAKEYFKQKEGDGPGLSEAFARRIARVLEVAMIKNHSTLLLGAWGCGVFQNDPNEVAAAFMANLKSKRFQGCFKEVVFAVYDPSESRDNYRSFRDKIH